MEKCAGFREKRVEIQHLWFGKDAIALCPKLKMLPLAKYLGQFRNDNSTDLQNVLSIKFNRNCSTFLSYRF